MKRTLMTVIALAVMASGALAQSTGNILTNIVNYATSMNTNLTWVGNKLEVEAGAHYQNNLLWENSLRVNYNLNDSFSLGAQMDNAGIAGTIVAYQGGVSYAVINSYDIKCEAGVDAGYSHLYNSGVVDPRIIFKKKMTSNTYTFFELGEPVYISHRSSIPNPWVPDLAFGVGATY